MERRALEISRLLEDIRTSRQYENQIVHIEKIPEREALYGLIELKVPIKRALAKQGIEKLYSHQTEAIEKIRKGEDLVLSTTTASGKSLTYLIPIFETLIEDPEATTLYISPLNALVNDQLKTFLNFEEELGTGANINRYTGALSAPEKRKVREGKNNIIFTNPEMVHMSFLAWHHLWRRFFSHLKFIVLDESHYYRGVIGSNMANLLRRLTRIAKLYGADPQFICCSATIGNPKEHTEALIGREVSVVDKNGSTTGPRKFMFWNPPLYLNKKGFTLRRSSFADASALFTRLVQNGLQTLAFTRSRQGVERMYKSCKEGLRTRGISTAICSYRSGYFDREREEIEKQLADGTLGGVISTNALELGIDIGSLDACILDGYPGTLMSARQQAGRAGRTGKESLVVLVAGSNALDQYYMRNPEDFFGKDSENAVINPENPYILTGHLLCAAKELPLREEDKAYFGGENSPTYHRVVELLEAEGLLTGGKFKTSTDPFPQKQVSLRGIDNNSYTIINFESGRPIRLEKDIEESLAFRECHPGAVYMHRGEQYHITGIDHEKKEIRAARTHERHYTRPMIDSSLSVREEFAEKRLRHAEDVKVGLGAVEVTDRVVGYRKIQTYSEDTLSSHTVEMPPVTLETVALWLRLPNRLRELTETHNLDYAGGLHAIEHAMISMYPLHLLVDRNDVGGLSATAHPDLQGASGIFVYDGHRGGVGYAEKGYEVIENVLEGTLRAVETCPCESGCPGCIQSPKCGNNNEPLDKYAAILLLHELLGKNPYVPPKKEVQKEKHLAETRDLYRSEKKPKNPDRSSSLDRIRRKLVGESIKEKVGPEPAASKEKGKTFVATDARGNMLGVISAPRPEVAAAKVFREKMIGKVQATKESPFEVRVRDLEKRNDYFFQVWIGIVEKKKDPEGNFVEGEMEKGKVSGEVSEARKVRKVRKIFVQKRPV